MPEALREPGRRIWQGDRETWKLFSSGWVSPITDVVVAPSGDDPDRILIAAPAGAYWTGRFPEEGEAIPFEESRDDSVAWDVEAIDVDGDGVREFVNRGGNWHPVSAFAQDGRLLWRQGTEWGANQMAPGDLDGDGRLDFVIGMNGRGGLRRVDADGNEVWRAPGRNIWDVELVDVDADGRDEILHSCCAGISIRGGNGVLIRELALTPSPFRFDVVRWPDLRVVYPRGDQLWLAAVDGSGSVAYPLGFDPGGDDVRAKVFATSEGRTALAVLIDLRSNDRALLNLYDADGRIFYQEVLPWSCPELEVLETGDPDGDLLLLGCDGWLALHGPYLPLWKRSIAFTEAALGPDSPQLLEDLTALSWALVHRDRAQEALPHAMRAVAIARAAAPESDNRLADALNALGMVENELGRREQALAHLESALAELDPEQPGAAGLASGIHYNLGTVHHLNGELERAEQHYAKSLERADLPPISRISAEHNLARVYLDTDRLAEAEQMARVAIADATAAYSADHPEVAQEQALLAEILRAARESASPPASHR